jgi:hypothetical protein
VILDQDGGSVAGILQKKTEYPGETKEGLFVKTADC